MFRRQSQHFEQLGSPVYARLAGRLAEDPRPAGAILGDDASWDLGLRLFGAVHHHVLTGVAPSALSGDWDDFASALDTHAGLAHRVRPHPRRADERDAALRGARARIPLRRPCDRPPARADRARAERRAQSRLRPILLPLRRGHVRRSRRSALVRRRRARPRSRCAARDAARRCRRRRGIDLSPIDVTLEEDVTLLHSFLWPGLTERATAPRRRDRDVPVRSAAARADPRRLRRPPARPPRRTSGRCAHGRLPDRVDRIPHARALRRAPSRARRCRGRRPAARVGVVAPPATRARRPGDRRLGARAVHPPRCAAARRLVDFHGNWVDWLAA